MAKWKECLLLKVTPSAAWKRDPETLSDMINQPNSPKRTIPHLVGQKTLESPTNIEKIFRKTYIRF